MKVAVLLAALLQAAWPVGVERWRAEIEAAAERTGLEPAVIAAVVLVESAGDPLATGAAGEVGLMQIMPFEWRPAPERLREPAFNVLYGALILAQALRQAGGDTRLALAWYNCGSAGVAAGQCGVSGGYAYADRVLAACRELGGCRAPAREYEPW